jgi:hypothetical protein
LYYHNGDAEPNRYVAYSPSRGSIVKFGEEDDGETVIEELKEYTSWINVPIQIGRFDTERKLFVFKIMKPGLNEKDVITIAQFFVQENYSFSVQHSEIGILRRLMDLHGNKVEEVFG